MIEKQCTHCREVLSSEREQFILCCYQCRRYALLHGIWPEDDPFFRPILEES